MHGRTRRLTVITAAAALALASAPAAQQAPPAATARINIPVEYHTLSNGLKVVLSRDTSSPTAVGKFLSVSACRCARRTCSSGRYA